MNRKSFIEFIKVFHHQNFVYEELVYIWKESSNMYTGKAGVVRTYITGCYSTDMEGNNYSE